MLNRPVLVELIALILRLGFYTTRAVDSPARAEAAVAEWQPHLVVLDMDVDGMAIIALLSRTTPASAHLPVIGLTRRGNLTTKLAAFEAGVDDILAVPFAPEELLARVIAVTRRAYGDVVTFTPVIKMGDLEVDVLNRTVRDGILELHLTALELSLLYLLAANVGRVVTREEILDTLWGTDFVAESNIIDGQIRRLRRRLQDDRRHPRFIATVRGRGYRFLGSVSAGLDSAATSQSMVLPIEAIAARPRAPRRDAAWASRRSWTVAATVSERPVRNP